MSDKDAGIRMMAESIYETNIAPIIKERDAAIAERDQLILQNRELIAALEAVVLDLKWRGEQLDFLLNNHHEDKDGECAICGKIMCPFGDPLHFHHDGCPSCATAPSDHGWLRKGRSLDEYASVINQNKP